MAQDVARDLESLHLSSDPAVQELAENWIDHHFQDQHIPKKPKLNVKALKQALEDKYLSPPTSFSAHWLNQLQQYCDLPDLAW